MTNNDATQGQPLSMDWITRVFGNIPEIIKALPSHLRLAALLALLLSISLILAIFALIVISIWNPNNSGHWHLVAPASAVGLLTVAVSVLFFVIIRHADSVERIVDIDDEDSVSFEKATDPDELPDQWQQIYGADRPAPPVNTWNRQLRPALYQASYYSIPTYYLDPDLYIVDFNAAFEAVFRRISGTLRGQHVNWFIKAMENRDDMFRRGQEFTQEIAEKLRFPFVHLEPIRYASDDFGSVEFTKVASQLHDADGRLCGWAVALMPREIDWPEFERVLETKLYQDKLWSVYSGPYDRVLPGFAPYRDLIEEVISVVPDGNAIVGDLGAGTGNVTQQLVARGHRVVAIENSLGMLDRLTQKTAASPDVTVVKASIENLGFLQSGFLDAVVMVNVLYAVDDPIGCLRDVHRMLRPDGVLGLSTTHRETRLDELLRAIEDDVEKRPERNELAADYALIERVNRDIENSIARRHTRQDYRRFLETAGFEVTRTVDSTYHNAVMVLHARKRE